MLELLKDIKINIEFYLLHFSFIDYVFSIWILLVFLVVLILIILIIAKHPILSVFLLFLNLCFLVFGTIFTHQFIDKNVRKREININYTKQLIFSDTFIIDLNITNESKKDFNYCEIRIKFYKPSRNKFKNYLHLLRPFYVKTKIIKDKILQGETKNLKLIINNFRPLNYKITNSSECF